MARTGVTYYDIAKAAESIKSQGKEPTVDRVRELLGTGSKSTIAPLLKRWRSDSADDIALNGLPSELANAVMSLHEGLQQAADVRIDEARANFEADCEKFRAELDNVKNDCAQLEAQRGKLENQAEALNAENRRQSMAFEKTRLELAKTQAQRDEAVQRSLEYKEVELELKQENRDIRGHFEHYQQRTAEDRRQERAQFSEQKHQLLEQIEEQKSQLAQAQAKTTALVNANASLQQDSAEIKRALDALQASADQKTDEIRQWKHELEVALEKIHQGKNERQDLRNKIAEISEQKVLAERQAAILTLSSETANAELISVNSKLEILSDENKILMQEKAVLQGQFMQLQASLGPQGESRD